MAEEEEADPEEKEEEVLCPAPPVPAPAPAPPTPEEARELSAGKQTRVQLNNMSSFTLRHGST